MSSVCARPLRGQGLPTSHMTAGWHCRLGRLVDPHWLSTEEMIESHSSGLFVGCPRGCSRTPPPHPQREALGYFTSWRGGVTSPRSLASQQCGVPLLIAACHTGPAAGIPNLMCPHEAAGRWLICILQMRTLKPERLPAVCKVTRWDLSSGSGPQSSSS